MEELHSSLLEKAAVGIGWERLGEEVSNVMCGLNLVYFNLLAADKFLSVSEHMWLNVFGSVAFDITNSDLCHSYSIILEEDSWLGLHAQAALICDGLVNVPQPNSLSSCFMKGDEFGMVRGSSGGCLLDRLPGKRGVVLEEEVTGLKLAD